MIVLLSLLLLLSAGQPSSSTKSDPDFVERLQRPGEARTPTIKCFVCSPCNSTADQWDKPVLSECLPGEQFCFREIYDDGSLFLSCSNECETGNFTKGNKTSKVECCSGADGCNKVEGLNRREKTTTLAPAVELTTLEATTSSSTAETSSPSSKPAQPSTTRKSKPTITTTSETSPPTTMTPATKTTATTAETLPTASRTRISKQTTKQFGQSTPAPTTAIPVVSDKEPIKCFVCPSCDSKKRARLTDCKASEHFCYKEILEDGSLIQSCAEACPVDFQTKLVGPKTVSNECCNDRDGCNGHLDDDYVEKSSSPALIPVAGAFLTMLSFAFGYFMRQ